MSLAPTTAPRTAVRTAATAITSRVRSVDVLRGLVMILMAIDHVRVYSGVPAGGPTAAIFLTRWVTHFCAPVFVFLAGTSAFLYAQCRDRGAVSRYLVTRGLILIAMEMTIVRWSWTFDAASLLAFQLAGVIWMLGWCMVLLAGVVHLSIRAIAITGIALIAAQDVLRLLDGTTPAALQPLMQFVYFGGNVGPVSILYTLMPWIGVIAAGYAFGALLLRPPAVRDRALFRIGLSATVAFVVLATLGVWIEGNEQLPGWMQLLNQRKYPASQLFLLMTLGPAIAAMPLFERARGRVVDVLSTFGRVPMFYYLLHIPAIHALALVVWSLRDGSTHHDWFVTAPYVSIPAEQQWNLAVLYLVFALAIAILYFPCRSYAIAKARGGRRWMQYL